MSMMGESKKQSKEKQELKYWIQKGKKIECKRLNDSRTGKQFLNYRKERKILNQESKKKE